MEQSPSQKATCTSVRKETACTLCNMKVHYGVHKSLPLVPLLSHINPVHASQPIPLRSILIIFSHLCLSLPTGSFLQVSPPKSCRNFSPTPYVSHAPPISFSLIWSTTLHLVKNTNHAVHHYSTSPVTCCYPLGTNILPITGTSPCSGAPSASVSPLIWESEFRTPKKREHYSPAFICTMSKHKITGTQIQDHYVN